MIVKEKRITRKSDFDLFKKEKVLWGKYFGIVRLETTSEFKLGFVLSKKSLPRAVDRNRFRRLVSEVVQKNETKMRQKWTLVIAKEEAINKNYNDIYDEMVGFVFA